MILFSEIGLNYILASFYSVPELAAQYLLKLVDFKNYVFISIAVHPQFFIQLVYP